MPVLTQIGTSGIKNDAVTNAKIGAGAVGTTEVTDDAVTTAKLAADAVTAAKLADDSVVTANIVDGNVTAVKTTGVGKGKNILINGAMQIYQRGSTTFAHDGTTSGYSLDRFNMALGGNHEQLDGTLAQVADHPTSVNGKSLKWTTGTAESSYDADEYIYVTQKIEAQNLQHLQYGNSNAQTITVSFYVKSSVTGTYALGLYKPDSTARIFNKTYTISSANTWEKKTVTFVGDTGGGGIVNDNGQGLWVTWHLAAGSNAKGASSSSGWVNYAGLSNWADGQGTNAIMTTASATWQMTECQVEVGDSATDFEHRSFGEELALCHRYFYRWSADGEQYSNLCIGGVVNSSSARGVAQMPQTMRTDSAITSNGSFRIVAMGGNVRTSVTPSISRGHPLVPYVHFTGSGGGSLNTGYPTEMGANADTDAYIDFSAEL